MFLRTVLVSMHGRLLVLCTVLVSEHGSLLVLCTVLLLLEPGMGWARKRSQRYPTDEDNAGQIES